MSQVQPARWSPLWSPRRHCRYSRCRPRRSRQLMLPLLPWSPGSPYTSVRAHLRALHFTYRMFACGSPLRYSASPASFLSRIGVSRPFCDFSGLISLRGDVTDVDAYNYNFRIIGFLALRGTSSASSSPSSPAACKTCVSPLAGHCAPFHSLFL